VKLLLKDKQICFHSWIWCIVESDCWKNLVAINGGRSFSYSELSSCPEGHKLESDVGSLFIRGISRPPSLTRR